MTDRPILFSGPMVNAILEGQKTQTRRVLKPQPPFGELYDVVPKDRKGGSTVRFIDETPTGDWWHVIRTPYEIGDHLYVREAWCLCGQMNEFAPSKVGQYEPVGYLADGSIRELSCGMISQGRTRASMHMPRWASRLTLVVTDVRVQRLREISEVDAKAEGVTAIGAAECPDEDMRSYVWAFNNLWDGLNDARGFGWDTNPWVVAVTFETHKCNIDQMEAT